MYKNQKGEIATFISIAALIGMAVLSFITSNINTNTAQKQTTTSKAYQSCVGMSYDEYNEPYCPEGTPNGNDECCIEIADPVQENQSCADGSTCYANGGGCNTDYYQETGTCISGGVEGVCCRELPTTQTNPVDPEGNQNPESETDQTSQTNRDRETDSSSECRCVDGFWTYDCPRPYASCEQQSQGISEESQSLSNRDRETDSSSECRCVDGFWTYDCPRPYASCEQQSQGPQGSQDPESYQANQQSQSDGLGNGTCTASCVEYQCSRNNMQVADGECEGDRYCCAASSDTDGEDRACSIGHCAGGGSSSCDPAYDQTDETCRDSDGPSVCCKNKEYTPVACSDTSFTCRINMEDCNAFSNPGTYLQGESCREINGGAGVCCKENPDSKPQQSGSSCSDSSYTCMPYNDCSEVSSQKTYISGGACQTEDGTSGTCCKEAGASETAECTGSCFTETCTTVNRTGANGRCEEDKNCCAREENLISASGDCESNGGQCIGEGSYDETKQTRVSGKCPIGYGDVSICVKDKPESEVSGECEAAEGKCIDGGSYDETKQIKISGRCPAALGEPNVCVKDKDATEKKKCEDLGGECLFDTVGSGVDTKTYQKLEEGTCEWTEAIKSCYKKTEGNGEQGYVLIMGVNTRSQYVNDDIGELRITNVSSEFTKENPANVTYSFTEDENGSPKFIVNWPDGVDHTFDKISEYQTD